MREYHKIQTVYLRDPETKYKTLLEGQFAKPEFEFLKNNTWWFSEKVDGTNIRVMWNGEHVRFAGKTDRTEIPPFLFERLTNLFQCELFLSQEFPPMCLYGEGYGTRIQKGGGDYLPDRQDFVLFDVLVDGIWLERHNIQDIARKLELQTVPLVGGGSLLDGIDLVRRGFDSQLRKTSPEGLVMRPKIELLNRRGERVITKLKGKDFQK